MDNKPEFRIDPSPNPVPGGRTGADFGEPGLRPVFTDHMVTVSWETGKGWHDARVGERKPFQLDPASAVLHYAQEIFEGMKAYRTEQGAITLFRPEENARRFQSSAKRMAMPVMPEELFLEAVEQLVRIDRDWIPSGEGSLYLRPFMFADEAFLGVRPATQVHVLRHREPRRRVFQGRREADRGLDLRHLQPGCARRDRGREMRRKLCGKPPRAGGGGTERDAIRSCSWMRRNTAGSRNWAG